MRRQRQQRMGIVAVAVGAVVLAGIVLVVVVSSGGDGGADDESVAELDLFEWGIEGDLEVQAGPVRLAATNTGALAHNVGIRGGRISNEVAPGDSIELDLGELAPGIYEVYCDIVGHQEQGMIAPFVVTEPDQSR
jgi:hypothetical protein